MMQMTNRSSKLVKLVVLSLLATVSLILFFISFPLPMLPPYLKVDFSDIPALIAGLIFSPLAGIFVVFMKNVLYFAFSGATDPIGVIANFIAGTLFIFPVAYLYHRYKGVKSVISGLVIGTAGMAIIMSVLNYVIILPAYSWLIGMEMNNTIKWTSVIVGILPFNILKGIIVSMLFIPLFIKLKQWIEQKRVEVVG
ncbi:riboflavin transporter FmnP [Pseudogracilibacillus auburnensis]|uniref:Riboflavin transporter n=2 Tax=Pseudogracilibacillus auburnensis TaxID=1494959 RepID=A0A2V3VI81_9BACI|nr:riboflavin transporter FmnP [Pseudogracilibacillus auburnensis]